VAFLAIAILAGDAALASNLGTRFRKPMVLAGVGNMGNNWTSIPNLNPYGTAAGLCSATELVSSGLGARATISVLNPVTGAITSATCGTANAANLQLPACSCARIRDAGINAPTDILIAGAHDPNVTCTVPDAGVGQIGNLFYAVPYTGTARTVNDICQQAGLSSIPTSLSPASFVYEPADGSLPITYNCGTLASKGALLPLGDCFRIREPNGPKTFTPEVY
jgi:hypothetical protein